MNLNRTERIHADNEFKANIDAIKSKKYSQTIEGKVDLLLAEAEPSQLNGDYGEFSSDPIDIEDIQQDSDCFSCQILQAEQFKLHWQEYRTDSLRQQIHKFDPIYEIILWNDSIPEVHFLVFLCKPYIIDLFRRHLIGYHNNLIRLNTQFQTLPHFPNSAAHSS